MNPEIRAFNEGQTANDQEICNLLARTIDSELTEAKSKVWHAHPVWFIDGNPTVGYSKQKPGVRLMFWSGADFGEKELDVLGKKFKDACIFFNEVSEINLDSLKRWLEKTREIQWDYKSITKKKGRLEKLKKNETLK